MAYSSERKRYTEFFHVVDKNGTAMDVEECVYALNEKDLKISELKAELDKCRIIFKNMGVIWPIGANYDT